MTYNTCERTPVSFWSGVFLLLYPNGVSTPILFNHDFRKSCIWFCNLHRKFQFLFINPHLFTLLSCQRKIGIVLPRPWIFHPLPSLCIGGIAAEGAKRPECLLVFHTNRVSGSDDLIVCCNGIAVIGVCIQKKPQIHSNKVKLHQGFQ